MRKDRSRRFDGFTMVELLVVITIVMILASIAMPSFANSQDRARNAGVISNVHLTQLAVIQTCVDTQGRAPATGNLTSQVMNPVQKGYPRNGFYPSTLQASDVATLSGTPVNGVIGAVRAPGPAYTTRTPGAITYGSSTLSSYTIQGIGKRGPDAVLVAEVDFGGP